MFKKSILQPVLFLGLLTVFFVSCDKDFNELGTDIVGEDHFGFTKNTDVTIKSYNQKLGPIASNNLPINPLGFYNNKAFGTTQANFVTQVELTTLSPVFNNTDPDDYDVDPTEIDSVVMEIPYFKTFVKKSGEVSTYRLDSIYGGKPEDSKFKLSVYQSNYFLRDLDPSQSLAEIQPFYTDDNNTIDNNKIGTPLNDAPQTDVTNGIKNADGHENEHFYFDLREHRTSHLDDNNAPVKDKPTVPSMRLHLNNSFFTNLILHAPDGKLASNAVFKNYFRGLYFKVEAGSQSTANNGHMAMLNFKGGKITIYYNEDKKKGTGASATYDRVNKTYVLNLSGNTISLLNNTNENLDYLNAVNSPSEASKLYLKGGEGSISIIDLFNPTDNYRYVIKKISGKPVDEKGVEIPLDVNGEPKAGYYLTYEKVSSPNGISDELDDLRYPIYTTYTGVDYYSKKNRWMINEANLTFNIVTADMADAPGFDKVIEPMRIYLYDLTHKKTIADYSYDGTTNGLLPKFNKYIFGGILLDEHGSILQQRTKDENTGGVYAYKGTKYKIRITNHIRNLIKNDSTNVRIGVSVTESIGNVAFAKLRTPNSNVSSAPLMSVMSPQGTILYGTNPAVPDDKRLKLEIYYTKPN